MICAGHRCRFRGCQLAVLSLNSPLGAGPAPRRNTRRRPAYGHDPGWSIAPQPYTAKRSATARTDRQCGYTYLYISSFPAGQSGTLSASSEPATGTRALTGGSHAASGRVWLPRPRSRVREMLPRKRMQPCARPGPVLNEYTEIHVANWTALRRACQTDRSGVEPVRRQTSGQTINKQPCAQPAQGRWHGALRSSRDDSPTEERSWVQQGTRGAKGRLFPPGATQGRRMFGRSCAAAFRMGPWLACVLLRRTAEENSIRPEGRQTASRPRFEPAGRALPGLGAQPHTVALPISPDRVRYVPRVIFPPL